MFDFPKKRKFVELYNCFQIPSVETSKFILFVAICEEVSFTHVIPLIFLVNIKFITRTFTENYVYSQLFFHPREISTWKIGVKKVKKISWTKELRWKIYIKIILEQKTDKKFFLKKSETSQNGSTDYTQNSIESKF